MTSDVLLAGSVAVVLASVGASALVGFEAGRTEQIAAAWADGCAQLTAWRKALAKVLAPLLDVLGAPFVAVWDWACEVVSPVGTRRKEATR
jgi:hypothetical protein